MKLIYKTILLLFLPGMISCEQQMSSPVFHVSHEVKKENASFSDAVEVGDFLFLAGQIGMNHSTRTLVEGGIKTETQQAIENIQEVLEYHDTTLDNVVKCTVILSDIEDFSAFNEVYVKYFPNKPARTTFAVSDLARNAKIEIDVIAVK